MGKGLFIDKQCTKSVLQRSFRSGSILFFSYAFRDCTRIRGVNNKAIKYDEIQDLDPSFIPIINETLSGTRAEQDFSNPNANYNEPFVMSLGTPKTLENGLEQLWEISSQGEWCIPCRKCHHHNIPSLREDLNAMMGPKYRKEKVTPATPGIVCAKCGHYLYTKDGFWKHNFPERECSHAGYHLPQIVMNFHCEDDSAWTELQNKRFNRTKISEGVFYNEVCGESYDHGQKLISVTDLRNAAVLPHRRDIATHTQWIKAGKYKDWGVGVDWGGGGMSGISKTAFAVGGIRADGIVEIFTGHRSDHPNNFNLEANRTKDIMNTFNCQFCAMDFQGAGRLRLNKLYEVPIDRRLIYPFEY
ncbi:hypothetical protein FACS1894214_5200 [Planctomycetales bacterium]|nr:hypothetical protein FACS1894214_5200 [Planctomycetales bacterium]